MTAGSIALRAAIACCRSPTVSGKLLRISLALGTCVALLTVIAVTALGQQAHLQATTRDYELGAVYLERINALVYATVMESRGAYMSPDAAATKPYAENIERYTDEIGEVMADWRPRVRPDDAREFAGLSDRIDKFRKFRRELAATAVAQGPVAARALGDDQAVRTIRRALNQDLGALARVYSRRADALDDLKSAVMAVSWVLMLIAAATLMLVVGGTLLVRRSISRPLAEITEAIREVSEGRYATPIPHAGRCDEIGALAAAVAVFKHTMLRNELLDAMSANAEIERQGMQDEISRGRHQLDTTLTHVPTGMLMLDGAMNLVLCNTRYREMYRLPEGVAEPGMRLDGLMRKQAKLGAFAGDPATFARWATGREPTTGDLQLPDGRVIRISNRPLLTSPGWISVHEDITARLRTERELAFTEKLIGIVIENVSEAIVVIDAHELRYTLLNRAAHRLFGVSRPGIIGRTAREVFPDHVGRMLEENDREVVVSRRATAHDDHPIDTPGNGRRVVSVRRFPVVGKTGRPTFVLNVFEDRTEETLRSAHFRVAAE